MYRIIDEKGSGKTSRLMLLAKETGGVVVCSNPKGMAEKARAYGIQGIEFISYYDFAGHPHQHKKYYIDELENFIFYTMGDGMMGYSVSLED